MYACMDRFAPTTRDWFESAFGEPTAAQREAWPAIASGNNVLLIAPTGSGKTLAAFLSSIDGLMGHGARPESDASVSGVKVLYVSPLKALAVDVARNLTAPLDGIAAQCRRRGLPAPAIRVATRSGDTPPRERRAIASHPPDILVTTPESLYLLLTSKASKVLASVHTVILDEVHALAGSKRGAHLALSLERLETLSAHPIQRIGLSATVRPAEEAARFIGGGRPVTIVEPKSAAPMALRVVGVENERGPVGDAVVGATAGGATGDAASDSVWPLIERGVLDEVLRHHTTLVFVNSRGLAEKLTARLNDLYAGGVLGHDAVKGYGNALHVDSVVGSTTALVGSHDNGDAIAMAHHGSVSKDRRKRIEEDLKHGRLRCVVATSSLELGIDMGSVDLVIQIAPPFSVSSGLQRVGRADHQVGGISHALFYPITPRHLLALGATIEAMRAGAIEPLRVLRNPLDVLAQQTVAAAAMANLDPDSWYALVRRSAPFDHLDRTSFDAVIGMLTGAYDAEDFSAFRPPLARDRDSGAIVARPGAQRLAVTSGGTIPDRGQYSVVIPQDEGSTGPRRVGELDEEMVYESRVGDVITLGTSTWRIQQITHDRVVVMPAPGATARLPFWHGEGPGRDAGSGEALGSFIRALSRALCDTALHDSALDDTALRGSTSDGSGVLPPAPRFEAPTLDRLHADGMDDQAISTLAGLLDRQRQATGRVPDDRTLVVERCPDEQGDWRVILHSPYGRRVHEPWALAIAHRLSARYGFDGQCHAADDGIILVLPQEDGAISDDELFLFDESELQRDVEEQVGDSVLFAATFRECAARSLYMPRTSPGKRVPLWQQRLRAAQLLAAARKRRNFPLILETARQCLQDVYDMPALKRVMGRLRRGDIRLFGATTATPSTFADDLLFGFVGAVMYQYDVPQAERSAALLSMDAEALERLIGTDHIAEVLDPDIIDEVAGELGQRVFWNELDEADVPGRISRYAKTHGPFTADALIADLRVDAAVAVHELDALRAKGDLMVGRFTPDARVDQYLHREVFRRIRARSLAKARRAVRPVDASVIQRFVIERQGVGPVGAERHEDMDGLLRVIEQLEGVFLPAALWEGSVFPARLRDYEPMMLDAALASGDVVWVGSSPTGDGRTGDIAWFLADSPLLPAREQHTDDDGGEGAVEVTNERGHEVPAGRAKAVTTRISPPSTTATTPSTRPTTTILEDALMSALSRGGAYPIARLVELATRYAADHDHGAMAGSPTPDATGIDQEEWGRALWALVWRGSVTNSSFAPVRMRASMVEPSRASGPGVHGGGYGAGGYGAGSYRGRRLRRSGRPRSDRAYGVARAFSRWHGDLGGLWSMTGPGSAGVEERLVALVESMLDRYGIVAQPLVEKEAVPGGFSSLYPVLHGMENAGVLLRGMFVKGYGASQFARRDTIDDLRRVASAGIHDDDDHASHDPVVLDARDPANLAGWGVPWPEDRGDGRVRPTHRAGGMVAFVAGAPVLFAAPSARHLLGFVGNTPSGDGSAEQGHGSHDASRGDNLAAAVREVALTAVRSGLRNVTFRDIDGAPFDMRNPATGRMREAGFTPGPQGMTWYR
ncbi:DEAD/DEAH box helicase [Bifidobacterium mongoliense]|uniref:DEAD/DEAH box helicase n=1 Tax=Bifidobacterium mongoliense TaxID=518643 RepID=UPI0030ED8AC0